MLPDMIVAKLLQEDVDRGNPGESESCPIALCLRRQLGCDVQVTYTEVWVYACEYANGFFTDAKYPLPPEAQAFVKAFDNCYHAPKPITFNLIRI